MDDIDFTPVQHKTWAELYKRQVPKVRAGACSDYLKGFDLLQLPAESIPTLDFLNSKITPATGWEIVRTDERYSDAEIWYQFFDKKQFLVTNYMRSWEELDWTPEPDMFHDIFGHLPFFMLPHYARLQEMFAPVYLAADKAEREYIKRLAWYSTEFGMIREDGELKVFGTGLMSGGEEFRRAVEGEMNYTPFTVENVIEHDKVMYEQHNDLFVIESIDQVIEELKRYFDPILERAGKES
jgi:phenylalanine-4-hydroxylase